MTEAALSSVTIYDAYRYFAGQAVILTLKVGHA